MIKANTAVPALFGVAVFTLSAQLTLMDIIRSMAAGAAHCQIFLVGIATVTGCASDFPVFSAQGKFRFGIMVKCHLTPSPGHMTCPALAAIAALVFIIVVMTVSTC